MIPFVRELFSFEGRIARLQFWLTMCGLLAFEGLMILSIQGWTGHLSGGGHALEISVLLLFWPNLALTVKRGHDRGRSALYSFAFQAICTGSLMIIVAGRELDLYGLAVFGVVLRLTASLYLFVDYGLLDGAPGANRYGPRPRSYHASRPGHDALPGSGVSA